MAVRAIHLFPDPILKTPSIPVSVFDDALRALAADLIDTLQASPGVGLAAPQIGESKRVILVDVTRPRPDGRPPAAGHGRLLLVNPVIVRREGTQRFREGCLSVPDFLADIQRAARITLEAFDTDEHAITLDAEGFEAVALQHEMDHLDGLLFLDRVANLKTDLFRRGKPRPR